MIRVPFATLRLCVFALIASPAFFARNSRCNNLMIHVLTIFAQLSPLPFSAILAPACLQTVSMSRSWSGSLCESREKARRAIMAGQVTINGQPARKPGDRVRPADELALAAPEKYVSRGGFKLEHALQHFKIDCAGKTAIDLGASTGGFTDCLLQKGAAKVFAVDVGHGQLAWKLRQDPRVVVMEKTNARELSPASFPRPPRPLTSW